MKNFVIEPLKGFGEIPFGMSLDDAVKLLGTPNYYEELSDMEETGNRSIYYEYEDLATNIYFEGITKSVAACFETENDKSELFGTKVFDLNRSQVIELMRENGFSELEEEDEDGEHRISFEDALIDFFYDGDTMTAVSWGVLVDDQGNII
ncbi:MAG: hypothetical protein IKR29_03330 [Bacteroidales bacterium]|jgi:hypothetical protein|nr:hypothetical protein [Bacteroidales bacterium]